jgi:hypothetical protein
MEIMKTEAQAAEFANGLADAGDAMLFRDLWERRELDLIRGHFPDFMGGKEEAPASTVTEEAPASTVTEEAPASTVTEEAPASTVTEEAPASTVTANESTDETQAAASGNDAAAAE